jgi:hypothetical protein
MWSVRASFFDPLVAERDAFLVPFKLPPRYVCEELHKIGTISAFYP